ncbi:ABC transporter permease [Salarchaeum japonicum]|uniref:ABC transporter permease n=1 Tax=Salarchaeum japonicum TaxID=555573 RepID=UPI003C745283
MSKYRRALERLVDASAKERIAVSAAALALSILVGALVVFVSGIVATCASPAFSVLGVGVCYDPINVFTELFLGALGHPEQGGWSPTNYRIAIALQQTTLLIFTGLAVAVSFRAGLFNIGVQGQLVFGALAAAVATIWAGAIAPTGILGTVFLVPLGLLAGAIAGGLYGALPGALKAYGGANEVITTIMLNFIASNVAYVLVSTFLMPESSQLVQTAVIPAAAKIPNVPFIGFEARDAFSLLALLGALAFITGIAYLLAKTSFGYDIRTSGLQEEAAAYSGVDAKRTTVLSMALSGALAGVGGAVWVLMVKGRFLTGLPSLGFDGITVSILAGNNPIGVGAAAFLFGVLKSGTIAVDFSTDVPVELVDVLRGLIILFVAMPEFFRLIGKRYLGLGGEQRA